MFFRREKPKPTPAPVIRPAIAPGLTPPEPDDSIPVFHREVYANGIMRKVTTRGDGWVIVEDDGCVVAVYPPPR